MKPSDAMLQAAHNALAQCMKVKEGESVLIVSNHEKQSVADALFQAAIDLKTDPYLLIYPAGKVNGEEPPALVGEMMKKADVVIAPTVVSISHTDARRNACANGHTRISTLPGITEEIFERGLGSDYDEIAALCRSIYGPLHEGRKARVTAPNGTDVEIDMPDGAVVCDGDISAPGAFSNLPDGEVLVAPTSANGVIVADRCARLITEPTRITVKDGFIVDIEDNESGRRFREMIEKTRAKDGNNNAAFIAEFAIGTNKKAKVTGVVLEDEKVYGTCHIAFGDNTSYPGGKNPSNWHMDVIIFKPTVSIDGRIIQQDGEIVV